LQLPQGKDSYWIGGWVGTTSDLYATVHRTISTPATSQTQVIQPTIICYTDRTTMASIKLRVFCGIIALVPSTKFVPHTHSVDLFVFT